MTTTTPPVVMAPVVSTAKVARKRLTSPWASLVAVVSAVMWTTPTLGLLLTSFRSQKHINPDGWWNVFTNPSFTLENYQTVFKKGTANDLSGYFVNSFVITLPAVLAPLLLASMAAYAFAWMQFKGRDTIFVIIFALQVVPLQIALIPLLKLRRRHDPICSALAGSNDQAVRRGPCG